MIDGWKEENIVRSLKRAKNVYVAISIFCIGDDGSPDDFPDGSYCRISVFLHGDVYAGRCCIENTDIF